ncbi:pentatricopeptide repeat-containing protein at5g10690 [Phtheirospermum japonicum]|uniref:Pentatricopeptide repeat-containing protein at5g10690 n=1 Tax=Phtheirospermum japonicum TaxID=374723 RepID=A0A830CY22_9LAMI|nr:pentatricopeptide repeat-containing protein at5g10690 [Phtheirospermum japonicum]
MSKPEGCGVDEVTYGTLLKGLGDARRIDEAFQVLESVEKGDLGCANGLLARYGYALQEDGISNVVFQGYITSGCFQAALAVHDEILRHGLNPDRLSYNTLIFACNKNENLGAAMRFFERMKNNDPDLSPDLVTYTTLLQVSPITALNDKARCSTVRAFKYARYMATELSHKCCEELVAAGPIGTLLKLICSVGRSIPDQQVLKHALSTLRNLARYLTLAEILVGSQGCMETIILPAHLLSFPAFLAGSSARLFNLFRASGLANCIYAIFALTYSLQQLRGNKESPKTIPERDLNNGSIGIQILIDYTFGVGTASERKERRENGVLYVCKSNTTDLVVCERPVTAKNMCIYEFTLIWHGELELWIRPYRLCRLLLDIFNVGFTETDARHSTSVFWQFHVGFETDVLATDVESHVVF